MGNCFATEVPEPPSFNPNRIGLDHFEIQRVLGKGGFGKVYLYFNTY